MTKRHWASLTAIGLMVVASLAQAQQTSGPPIADYGDEGFRLRAYDPPPTLREDIRKGLARRAEARQKLGTDFYILGDAPGAFTQPGGRERIVLVSNKAPVASDLSPRGMVQYLAVMERGTLAALYPLPASRVYSRLIGAIDADRSGRDEALAEISTFRDGRSTLTLDRLALNAAGNVQLAQTIEAVFDDSCAAARGARQRKAQVLSLDATRKALTGRETVQTCS